MNPTRRHLRMPARQRGATLVVALMLLVIVTLFGITAISTSRGSLIAARNTQVAVEAQAAAQRMIDTRLSTLATFYPTPSSGAAEAVDALGTGANKYTVTKPVSECVYIKAAPGYSYQNAPFAPKDTLWHVSAQATESGSNVSVTVRQGVKVRLPPDATCP